MQLGQKTGLAALSLTDHLLRGILHSRRALLQSYIYNNVSFLAFICNKYTVRHKKMPSSSSVLK